MNSVFVSQFLTHEPQSSNPSPLIRVGRKGDVGTVDSMVVNAGVEASCDKRQVHADPHPAQHLITQSWYSRFAGRSPPDKRGNSLFPLFEFSLDVLTRRKKKALALVLGPSRAYSGTCRVFPLNHAIIPFLRAHGR